MEDSLTNFFEEYMGKESIFLDRKAVQSGFTPTNIPHRIEQINSLAGILAPALKGERPSNVFIYGKTGTGKTLVTKYVTENMANISLKNSLNLKVFYINCKIGNKADTEYRLFAQLCKEFGFADLPDTGLPTDVIVDKFKHLLEEKKVILIIILDEVDELVRKIGASILYKLPRLNADLKESEISLIGISNDLTFLDNIDPRARSSLSEEEMVFPPYNALQLQNILRERANIAFRKNVIDNGVIEKCAAHAAKEHGDARRALDLLRVAAELAERQNQTKIMITNIDDAEDKIDRDKIFDSIKTQPKQHKLTLFSIFEACSESSDRSVFTGEIYNKYIQYCSKVAAAPLTQRRVSDIIAELDMQGIINAKVMSRGRGGRTRKISLAMPSQSVPKLIELLKEGLNL